MEWIEKIYVNGKRLEAFTTSGGLGTMCETCLGRVENLDYKSMRYPGHVELMNFFFHELLMREKRDLAGEILTHAKPPVDDDVVHIHISAEGIIDGRLLRKEYVRSYYPIEISGRVWRAIASTTSASVCAVIETVNQICRLLCLSSKSTSRSTRSCGPAMVVFTRRRTEAAPDSLTQ